MGTVLSFSPRERRPIYTTHHHGSGTISTSNSTSDFQLNNYAYEQMNNVKNRENSKPMQYLTVPNQFPNQNGNNVLFGSSNSNIMNQNVNASDEQRADSARILSEKNAIEKNLKKHSLFINALSWRRLSSSHGKKKLESNNGKNKSTNITSGSFRPPALTDVVHPMVVVTDKKKFQQQQIQLVSSNSSQSVITNNSQQQPIQNPLQNKTIFYTPGDPKSVLALDLERAANNANNLHHNVDKVAPKMSLPLRPVQLTKGEHQAPRKTIIQDYEVFDWELVLGKGGFATVYKARCRASGHYVAIKRIDKEKMYENQMEERVRQEVAIHSRLKHPAILDLHTFFEDDEYVYLVLELAHNGTLLNYLNNQTLDEVNAAIVLSQVVSGLHYLHSNNIMHRDLSMSNLLLTETMQVKISDFGLAAKNQPLKSQHTTLCGTPNYISPEVAMHSPHGLETDVWGLGCLLYALLVGRPPFDSNAVKSTLTQVVMGSYVVPEHVSGEARNLIDRLLCKDPKKRILLHEVSSHPFMMRKDQTDSGIMTNSSVSKSLRSRSADRTNKSQRLFFGHASIHHFNQYYPQDSPPFVPQAVPAFPQAQKRIEVPPLNTERLQPTRHKTKSVILSIVEEPPGEVVIEFLEKNNSNRVQAVCRISNDGLRIVLYKPNNGKGVEVRNSPPALPGTGADSHFGFESLPEKHWKKYLYAHRFVQMVRAKTPKVTFYSKLAKCQLMENVENFEMFLYKGGKVTKKDDGFHLEANVTSNEGEAITEHAASCYKHCVEIERRMSGMPQEFPCFPIIIGRRPAEHVTPKHQPQGNTFNNYISASHTPVAKPNIYMPAYSFEKTPMSSQRVPPLGHYNHRVPDTPPATPLNNFHSKTSVGVKNVSHFPDGSAQIDYCDGSRMVALAGGNGVNYWTSDGQSLKYNRDECLAHKLPHSVQAKFDALPYVLQEHLQRQQKSYTASTPKPSPLMLLNMR